MCVVPARKMGCEERKQVIQSHISGKWLNQIQGLTLSRTVPVHITTASVCPAVLSANCCAE